jgi:hypothetical protein
MMNERGLSVDHTTIYRSSAQVEGIGKGDIRGQVRFVADLFNGAA